MEMYRLELVKHERIAGPFQCIWENCSKVQYHSPNKTLRQAKIRKTEWGSTALGSKVGFTTPLPRAYQ